VSPNATAAVRALLAALDLKPEEVTMIRIQPYLLEVFTATRDPDTHQLVKGGQMYSLPEITGVEEP
jgi:hypothetical protein